MTTSRTPNAILSKTSRFETMVALSALNFVARLVYCIARFPSTETRDAVKLQMEEVRGSLESSRSGVHESLNAISGVFDGIRDEYGADLHQLGPSDLRDLLASLDDVATQVLSRDYAKESNAKKARELADAWLGDHVDDESMVTRSIADGKTVYTLTEKLRAALAESGKGKYGSRQGSLKQRLRDSSNITIKINESSSKNILRSADAPPGQSDKKVILVNNDGKIVNLTNPENQRDITVLGKIRLPDAGSSKSPPSI